MPERNDPPSTRGRRWFLAILLVMVTLATAAGLALARSRDDSATGTEPIPTGSEPFPS